MLSDNGLAEKGEVYMSGEITGAVLCGGVRIGCAMRARKRAERVMVQPRPVAGPDDGDG
jgi:hypothetical protein